MRGQVLALCRIHEGPGIGNGDLGIGDDGLRTGNITDEEIVDDGNVHAAKKAQILAPSPSLPSFSSEAASRPPR